MFVLIDNYDSFTFNLFHYLGEAGVLVEVFRNDAISVDALADRNPEAIVLSPGPCDPDRAGICLDIVRSLSETVPILGVCLGHQTIGQAFGGTIVRAPQPMHGKTDRMTHDGSGVFQGLPSPFTATRYHSLTIDPPSLPPVLDANARASDGVIMGVRHKTLPVHGVQFHPESIETEHGHQMIARFVAIARSFRQSGPVSAPKPTATSDVGAVP